MHYFHAHYRPPTIYESHHLTVPPQRTPKNYSRCIPQTQPPDNTHCTLSTSIAVPNHFLRPQPIRSINSTEFCIRVKQPNMLSWKFLMSWTRSPWRHNYPCTTVYKFRLTNTHEISEISPKEHLRPVSRSEKNDLVNPKMMLRDKSDIITDKEKVFACTTVLCTFLDGELWICVWDYWFTGWEMHCRIFFSGYLDLFS